MRGYISDLWATIWTAIRAGETKKEREAEEARRAAPSAPIGDGSSSAVDKAKDALAKQVLLLNAQCKWADNYIEDSRSTNAETSIDGKAKLEQTIKRSLGTAQATDDRFYRSTMLHSVADLLSRAGQFERAEKVIQMIEVDFIGDRARTLLWEARKGSISTL